MQVSKTAGRARARGFTLIELLLVISIIAILSAVGISVMAGAEQDALESRTRAGIERISGVLNQKLEENRYRILPIRMLPGSTPQEVQALRLQAMAELLRVEFPFTLEQVSPVGTANPFPQNDTYPVNDPGLNFMRPRMVDRYWAKVGNATAANQDAELLYAILSLNFDESGQPLSSVLRQREIGDTDGDGALEVLDAFGDPLQFALLVKLTAADVNQVVAVDPDNFVQQDLADVIGYESILNQTQLLNPGQVRGPWPAEKYRLSIRSINLRNTDSGAVVTQ